jgi:hypothetical protein
MGPGEPLWTESSYKFTRESAVASSATPLMGP